MDSSTSLTASAVMLMNMRWKLATVLASANPAAEGAAATARLFMTADVYK
jgi:hypothetical protein